MKGLRNILQDSWTAKTTNEWVLDKAVRHCKSKKASILWSHHKETRQLPGERDNAKCTQLRKATRPGWKTSIRGQDSSWKSQSEW